MLLLRQAKAEAAEAGDRVLEELLEEQAAAKATARR